MLFGEDVLERFTAQASVMARATPQSTHPDAVAAQLADTRAWIARKERELNVTVDRPAVIQSPGRLSGHPSWWRYPHGRRNISDDGQPRVGRQSGVHRLAGRHEIGVDGATYAAASPMQLLALAIAGCMAVDLVHILTGATTR